MKILVAFLALASVVYAENVNPMFPGNTAYGYLTKFGIPEAERIRKSEESAASRIVGGTPAEPGEFPFQAGLLISINGIRNTASCGASLLSSNNVITAAHCLDDGIYIASIITVVFGSKYLYYGGTRIGTSEFVIHPRWFPLLIRNDIAVIYLPNAVTFSDTISPIALPTGADLYEDYAGQNAIASGFGTTRDGAGISENQFLSHVSLNVISNSDCFLTFPLFVQPSIICTSGIGGVGPCNGDSGGPLFISRNDDSYMLIGVISFGYLLGCQSNFPAGYTRVTHYMDFLNQHL